MGEVYNGLFDMDLTSISDDASKIIQRAAIQAKKAVESAGATLNLGLNYEGKDDRDPVVAQMEEAVSTIKGIWGTFAEVRSDVASLTKLLRDKQLPDAGKDYGDALAKIKNAKQVDYTAEASKNIQNAVLAARELDKCLAEAKLADEDADVAAVGVKQDSEWLGRAKGDGNCRTRQHANVGPAASPPTVLRLPSAELAKLKCPITRSLMEEPMRK